MEYPLPKVDFSFLPDALDSRHNTLSCSITAQEEVKYAWNMGDGTRETGLTIQHAYNISNSILQYLITLTAKTIYGCKDSSFKAVDVVPFIPNVFSPDGDGINDIFMSGFEMEIVDRNGLQLYKGNTGWDGRHNGQPADPDTYFYLIYYKDSNQKIHTRKGYVTLVR
jgi:gliding motility-associated-like protein